MKYGMAKALLFASLHKEPGEVFHSKRMFERLGQSSSVTEWSKLAWWGFIKKTKRRGYWKLTKKGVAFARGDLAVPEVAVYFRSRFFRNEGKLITIREVQDGFDLEKERKKLGA